MDTLATITGRRSTRQYTNTPVPRALVEQVLNAAVQAPSGHNRQPWRFVVLEGKHRLQMVNLLRKSIGELKAEGANTGSAEWSADAMEQAPTVIFVFDPYWPADAPRDGWSIVDVQSVGAAIQNMLLTAHTLGLGSLWVCDVYYAREELTAWLGASDCLVAAIVLGYPAETPAVRPRKPWQTITTWQGD